MTTADDADPHFTKHRFQMFIPPENRLKHALAARIRPIAPALSHTSRAAASEFPDRQRQPPAASRDNVNLSRRKRWAAAACVANAVSRWAIPASSNTNGPTVVGTVAEVCATAAPSETRRSVTASCRVAAVKLSSVR